MQVRFTRNFVKQYARAGVKIQKSFDNRLELFLKNSSDPVLNNHKLIGKLKNYGSINITGDWRAIYSENRYKGEDPLVIFEVLGTHRRSG